MLEIDNQFARQNACVTSSEEFPLASHCSGTVIFQVRREDNDGLEPRIGFTADG